MKQIFFVAVYLCTGFFDVAAQEAKSVEDSAAKVVRCITDGGSQDECFNSSNSLNSNDRIAAEDSTPLIGTGWVDGTVYRDAFLEALGESAPTREEEEPWYGSLLQGPQWGAIPLSLDAYIQ